MTVTIRNEARARQELAANAMKYVTEPTTKKVSPDSLLLAKTKKYMVVATPIRYRGSEVTYEISTVLLKGDDQKRIKRNEMIRTLAANW